MTGAAPDPSPARRPFRVVIAGSGPAAVEAALTFDDLAPDVDVQMLAADRRYLDVPMSVVAPFGHGTMRSYPLHLLSDRGIGFHEDRLVEVDVEGRIARTATGASVAYDALLVAVGAEMGAEPPGSVPFGGRAGVAAMLALRQAVERRERVSVAFLAPDGVEWTMPLYELALQLAELVDAHGAPQSSITVSTGELRPLELFGPAASATAEALLRAGRVGWGDSSGDRRIALAAPRGRQIAGLPTGRGGFLETDGHAAVRGLPHVWAAGDCTSQPVKQGGLATQQAAVAAHDILSVAGRGPKPPRWTPILRGLLVAGATERWHFQTPLRPGALGEVSRRPLWHPPSKIAGQRLGPVLDGLERGGSGAGMRRGRVGRPAS